MKFQKAVYLATAIARQLITQVVNADAEKIIIAMLGQKVKTYFSGRIENPEINGGYKTFWKVGEDAFLAKRKEVYNY